MRRWILIDFQRKMVQNPNPHLTAELLEERGGIFNWMLEGAQRVNIKGFTYTQSPEEMSRLYIERSEPIVEFLEDCYTADFESFEQSTELLAAYNTWAKLHKKKPMGSREFANAMKNQSVFAVEHHKQEVTRHIDEYHTERSYLWGFSGIKLLPPSQIETACARAVFQNH